MYKVFYTTEAEKQIKRLDERLKLIIKQAVEEIGKDPSVGKPLTRELKGRFSYRAGDYRIIYRAYHSEVVVLILTIGHRRDIYKKITRKGW